MSGTAAAAPNSSTVSSDNNGDSDAEVRAIMTITQQQHLPTHRHATNTPIVTHRLQGMQWEALAEVEAEAARLGAEA